MAALIRNHPILNFFKNPYVLYFLLLTTLSGLGIVLSITGILPIGIMSLSSIYFFAGLAVVSWHLISESGFLNSLARLGKQLVQSVRQFFHKSATESSHNPQLTSTQTTTSVSAPTPTTGSETKLLIGSSSTSGSPEVSKQSVQTAVPEPAATQAAASIAGKSEKTVTNAKLKTVVKKVMTMKAVTQKFSAEQQKKLKKAKSPEQKANLQRLFKKAAKKDAELKKQKEDLIKQIEVMPKVGNKAFNLEKMTTKQLEKHLEFLEKQQSSTGMKR